LFTEKLAVTGWRSAVAVPLMVEEKLFGVLAAARLQPDGFSSGDAEFLRMLSEHVALAAHQAAAHGSGGRLPRTAPHPGDGLAGRNGSRRWARWPAASRTMSTTRFRPRCFCRPAFEDEYGLDQNQKKYLKYIRTAGEDIAHIVARLREFYRTREDAEALQQLNLNELAEQVVDMTRPRWRDIPQSNGITIEMVTALATGCSPAGRH